MPEIPEITSICKVGVPEFQSCHKPGTGHLAKDTQFHRYDNSSFAVFCHTDLVSRPEKFWSSHCSSPKGRFCAG